MYWKELIGVCYNATVCADVMLAKRKKAIHTEAERHTLVNRAPRVLRLLLKRFMQVSLHLVLLPLM